jgi:aldose 1-epimerase
VKSYLALAAALALAACRTTPTAQAPPAAAGVGRSGFGRTGDGTPVDVFVLTNGRGVEVRAISYGAIITSVRVPDRDGQRADVVLGFDTIDGYLGTHPYFGAVVGRYGNRIAKGRFTLDGKTYQLATNNGPNHLHGGVRGFDKAVWRGEPVDRSDGSASVAFTHTSPDGDEGYPGTLNVRVTYTLTAANEIVIEYEATADKPTPVNLTQHSYFNLAGAGTGDILQHRLTIDADRFTPVDATLIPTGELATVAGTPFDFRQPTTIGARIDADDQQIKNGNGYDHNFVLNRTGGLAHAARLEDPSSGRTLDVSTTEPGVQFYAGNFLDGTITGKGGRVYKRRFGVCLETQHFPDSPNHPDFPSTILRPGERFQSKTVLAFGVMK